MLSNLANIISDDSLFNYSNIPYINYYSSTDTIIDTKLPTLIIGYKLAKQIYNSGIDILNKVVAPNQKYWTFTAEERNLDYIKDTKHFVDNVIGYYQSNQKYINYDPLFANSKSIYDFIDYIKNKEIKSYKNKYSLYIKTEDTIFGFDMRIIDKYYPNNNLINIISNKSNYYLDDNNLILSSCIKKYGNEISNCKKIIVNLISE
jgi:hypothetical protein